MQPTNQPAMTTQIKTKERPILFKGEMVRAILDGQKTQTRRIAKEFDGFQNMDKLLARFPNQEGCPYGKPGDRLWVRETWAVSNIYDKLAPSAICKDLPKGPNHAPTKVLYPSTDRISEGIKLRQSIFMPRWASRILLEVTDIRVERLNAISDADALAEGCSSDSMLSGDCLASVYARLWESINGEGSWEANPWVWVIGFRRVQP
jgi:hypothetical protein